VALGFCSCAVIQRCLNKADHRTCLSDRRGKNQTRGGSNQWNPSCCHPLGIRCWGLKKSFATQRVTIPDTDQRNHVPNCAAICVVLAAREREECISASDARWDCAWCLVSRNSTLKWICKGPQLWTLCVMIKQWSKVLQTFRSNQNYVSNKLFTPNLI
jgi:hypothetical protein